MLGFFSSAGIGRTGVLITMETAMCLIEANQPVYPLSIVRQMRDQRAMLIQTAVSLIQNLSPEIEKFIFQSFIEPGTIFFLCVSIRVIEKSF
jgi:tyrosine-protein phosphatase non-receptor type 4